ncbi:histidine phosphatase family protein [Rhodoferax sp.]|uniref:histidine phosphatase family protein n=1 Tax=Rhodoferax sp. TaxID=50421 RepID=UPI0025E661B1|nr:histidine phosphatase family protein [Rhodoferax sp.]
MKILLSSLRGLLWVAVMWMPVLAVHAADERSELQPGSMVLIRHALATGVGDPEHFALNDCRTQRNLNDEGRKQAMRIGAYFRQLTVPVTAVWSSQWCRTRETADLAFPGMREDKAAFNSFFGEPDAAPAQTLAAKRLLNAWNGNGLLVVVTHQVNITAIAGVVPASGEAVVLRLRDGAWVVSGRLTP